MTFEHLFFIPFVLCLGIVLGSQLTFWRLTPHTGIVRRVGVRGVLVPLLGFVALFVLTHVLSTHAGAKAVEDALGGQPLFDQQPTYDVRKVYERIESFGPRGRASYQHMTFTTDLVFPLTLCAFLVQLVRFVSERAGVGPNARRLGLLLPPLWLSSDLGENAIIHRLLQVHPEPSDALASMLGPLTHVKFALLVLCVGYCAALSLVASRDAAAPLAE